MVIDPDDNDLPRLKATIHRKRFAIANLLIMLVFILGNLLLPQVFFFPRNEAMFALGVFLSGVWGTQASTLGVYAAMANQSIIVRLTWFSVGLFACVLSILTGFQLASQGLSMRIDTSIAAMVAGIAFVSSSILVAVGLGVRSTLNVRLVDELDFRDSKNNTFNLVFLFRLTIAIALLMLGWTLSPLRFHSGFQNGPIVGFAKSLR